MSFLNPALAFLERIITARAPTSTERINYLGPAGDPGIFGPGSIAWRVLSNPASVFIGGITAVLLELAEPSVRSGVWDHTNFRTDPVGRMRRTGFAAMVITYVCTRDAEAAMSWIRHMHEGITSLTPDGQAYRANDPELLTWVHVTAAYGFLNAYLRHVNPRLTPAEQDRYYVEIFKVRQYYGIAWAPSSVAEVETYLERMRMRLRHHEILEEFLGLVLNAPVVSAPVLPMQRLLVQAAIDLLPSWAREILRLEKGQSMRVAARPLVNAMVTLANRVIRNGPHSRRASGWDCFPKLGRWKGLPS
jgi:uncharacterized protein (DUF2236 family)